MGRARGPRPRLTPSSAAEAPSDRRTATTATTPAAAANAEPQRRWTRPDVQAELLAFAERLGHRPSEHDFVTHNLLSLASAMSYHGGRESYRDIISHLPPSPPKPGARRRMGRPPGTGQWDDIRIWRELELYTRGMTQFPSLAQMTADRRDDLRSAVTRAGGIRRWSSLMQLPLGARQERSDYGEQDALRDARSVLQEHGRLPGMKRLRALGSPRLATYLDFHVPGGSKAFVARYERELGRHDGPIRVDIPGRPDEPIRVDIPRRPE